MSAHLLIAPSSAGKTEFVLRQARADAVGLARQPILCVPTPIQAQSARERLAALGGALGVNIFTFDQLYVWILRRSAVEFAELPDSARFRLMRDLLAGLAGEGVLHHYRGIAHTPGLATHMLELIGELQGALVEPLRLLDHWRAQHAPARLLDIAVLYAAWQNRLAEHDWSDRAGVGLLARKALSAGGATFPGATTPFYFDGFDFLNELQLQVVATLAQREGASVTVTLTGNVTAHSDAMRRNRFDATRDRLARALAIDAETLPALPGLAVTSPSLWILRQRLAAPAGSVPEPIEINDALILVEASQRETEVRAALRWIKRMLVVEGVTPSSCALLMRDSTVYRSLVLQIAEEFGLPVRLAGGLPLEENPAINALLSLLKLAIPSVDGLPFLPRENVVALLRSPYFDLGGLGVQAGDAERLDVFARSALITGSVVEWRTAFVHALAVAPVVPQPENASPDLEDESQGGALARADVERLATLVERLARGLQPVTSGLTHEHIAWLEALITTSEATSPVGSPAGLALGFLAALQRGAPAVRARDEGAFRAFKQILGNLLWSAEGIGESPVAYADFLQELGGALEGALFALPAPENAIFCGTTVQARGLPFSHVAVLGMVEGELPQRTLDDPFLRDVERVALQEEFPGVQRTTESLEREYFIEAIARAEQALLLTRPVIGDNGAATEASPYWLELRALSGAEPLNERAGALADPARAASLPELVRSLARVHHPVAQGWLDFHHAHVVQATLSASKILRIRTRRERSVYEGNLRNEPALIAKLLPAQRPFSPTAFENWLKCPYLYFAGRLMRLEARAEPEAEVGPAKLGSIYHEILQAVYLPSDINLSQPTERLETVARPLLERAPRIHGFIDTRLWRQQAEEILANLRRSVAALDALGGTPIAVERRYARENALRVESDAGDFLVHGVVDRIDALPNGTLRVVDYKTGKGDYDSPQGLIQGKRLQLPLYARMVEGELGAGKVSDGIYFFAHAGEAARWSLSSFPEGIEGAEEFALDWAKYAVKGMREGDFAPTPPAEGCPDWCPAAAFCWQYKPSGYRR